MRYLIIIAILLSDFASAGTVQPRSRSACSSAVRTASKICPLFTLSLYPLPAAHASGLC